MRGTTILLTLFVVLTIVFAAISVFQFATHNDTAIIQSSTTVITQFTTTTITTQPLPNQGLIQIVVGGTAFTYTQWNSSTPNTFTISNVKFALWTNTTVTNSGGSCYGAFGGFGGYVITFPDGSNDKMSTCTYGPNPPTTIRLTSHINPQAGILIIPSTGAVYFLVSA